MLMKHGFWKKYKKEVNVIWKESGKKDFWSYKINNNNNNIYYTAIGWLPGGSGVYH
jgi:hypothetical protein